MKIIFVTGSWCYILKTMSFIGQLFLICFRFLVCPFYRFSATLPAVWLHEYPISAGGVSYCLIGCCIQRGTLEVSSCLISDEN
jgi:hypothetical protein